jgi:diamine N-acetyltransferase
MDEFELKIRRGKPIDAETLAPLAVKIFNDTFAENPLNKPEDMNAYIAESMSVEMFRTQLEGENSIFFIAEIESKMIGYAMLNEGATEHCIADENPIELNRLYVLKDFHGKGIAEKLMNKCFEIALEKNFKTMWLGVWEFNYRAARFYEKIGFKKVGNHTFQLGSDSQIDLVMEKAL